MLKPIAKPVLIALTMMLMSLSPMVGTTSGTSSAYYQVHLDDGTTIYDGDILHIATDPAVQGGYYADTNFTLDLQGLVVGDSYEFSLMIHDGMGYNVYDQYDNITATGNDHQEIYLVGLQADCDYEADIDVSHWDGTTMMFVGHTTFEIDVGDGCEDIEDTYNSHIDSQHVEVVMMPDRTPAPDELHGDVVVFFKTHLDDYFRDHIDMNYGDSDGTVDETEVWDSGLYYELQDNGPSAINWTLDGVDGNSEGDDLNYFVNVDDLWADDQTDSPMVEAFLIFNITGLGGMSPGDSQYLTFHDFSSDGDIYFHEFGDMLMITHMDLDGNQSNLIPPYWDNTDTMFECSDDGDEIDWMHVNDGIEDCMNGEDETEDYDDTFDSDGDGNLTNDSDKMFTCDRHDDTGNSDQVNWNHINDGYEDCTNGEDEGYENFPGLWNVQQGDGDLNLDLEYPTHQGHDHGDNDDQDGEWWDDLGISFKLVNHQGENGVSLHLTYIFTSFNDTGAAKHTREMADSDEDGIVDDVEADQFVEQFREMIIDNDRTYYCHDSAGNEYEIEFELVNDGYEDCPDGADEPQDMNLSDDSDGDGDPTNDEDSWFDCNDHDMTTVNMNQVNDGVEDCPNGDDEGGDGDNNFPFYLDGEHLGEPSGNFFGMHVNLLGVVNDTNDTFVHATFEFPVNNASQHGIHKLELMENPSDCVDVVAGDAAPSDGEFTYASNGTTVQVMKGEVAPEAGEFCPYHEDDHDDHDDGIHGGTGNQNGTGGGNGDGTGGGNQDGGASNHDDNDNEPWSLSIVSSEDWILINVTTTDGTVHEGSEYHNHEFAPGDDLHMIALFEAANSTGCPPGEVMNSDGDCVAEPGPQDCPDGEVMNSDGDCVADPALNCPAGEVWDATTESCVDDGIVQPEDCVAPQIYQETNGTGACVDDTSEKPEDCTSHEMWDNNTASCVDDGLVHPEDCAANETHQMNSDGVGECVETVVEPEGCPEGFEDLDEDPTTACTIISGMPIGIVDSTTGEQSILLVEPSDTVANVKAKIQELLGISPDEQTLMFGPNELDDDDVLSEKDIGANSILYLIVGAVEDTAPTCEVFYWIGSAGTPQNDWNWTEMKSDWTEFDAPNNGEYTLALPPGDYFVYFGCWDEQGDDITLAVDGLPEIKEFEAEQNWVWGWDEFSITEEDMDMEHDMIVSWSSTDFGGNVTIHFKAVASIAESVAESDTAGLPGFTASLGLMAMLGAALVLTRRKDE